MSDGRDAIVDFIASRLIGPRSGRDEVIEGRPLLQYMMGILFGRGSTVAAAADSVAAGDDTPTANAGRRSEDEGGTDDWVTLTGEALPSAVGLSFVVEAGEVLRCTVDGASYQPRVSKNAEGQRKRGNREGEWLRVPLAQVGGQEVELREGDEPLPVLGGRGSIVSRWRPLGARRLVTVTLVNTQKQSSALDPERALFQVALACATTRGRVHPYPVPPKATEGSPEEHYLYRDSVPYARGHGAAADWTLVESECTGVRITFLPTADVALATFTLPTDFEIDARALSIDWLSRQDGGSTEVMKVLDTFVSAYEEWIARELRAAQAAGESVGVELANRAQEWARRMREGVRRLSTDPIAWSAFAHANKAMGSQMVLTAYLRDIARRGLSLTDAVPPDMTTFPDRGWRPFQLAFFLGTVEGLCSSSCPDRVVADVIWFPTGGGKTEAYLLVAAFELLRRRLVDARSERATAILSRYTLRMLTAQQFQRTAALFVALETMRRSDQATWGDAPFRLGLWVGGGESGLTPNRLVHAQEQLEEMRTAKGDRRNPFLLSRCPRCGTDMFPQKGEQWGVVASAQEFRLFCPSQNCPFGDQLPLDLVDESLYQSPPSMLIGTVDKFAQLAWDERAHVFFRGVDGTSAPPSLLIQDELHLISGPLGTLDAAYEAAVEEIIKRCGGPAPKIVCSTATIKNAAEQVRGLYARAAYVFPSPVRRWNDAFFYRSNPKNTRRYVGVMGQGYTKALMGLVWTSAALMQAVKEAKLTDSERDAFWTLVAYHNSRRELGRTMTAARDEIPTRIKVVATDASDAREIRGECVMQLSSQMSTTLDRAIRFLETSLGGAEPVLDIVPCTSIMSVGIDIDRLGLMLVNGQPKLTAEYIQATSRVGRGEVEGLVVTVFSAMKSRDRSHYEDFKGFHENLYRFVEPTSVTPLAPPARERTLHAALVSVIRHTTAWGKNADAAKVELEGPEVMAICRALVERAREMDISLAPDVEADLAEIRGRWEQHQQSNFLYDRGQAGAQFESLLCDFGGASAGLFPTMRSLRHVDAEVGIRFIQPGGNS